MNIRLLTAANSSAYQQLRLQALVNDPQSFLTAIETENSRQEQEYAAELDVTYHPPYFGYYGAFDGENLIGYCRVEQAYSDKQRHIAMLFNLYVDPAYRHQHIATELMTELIKRLKNHDQIERIFLTCRAQNKIAIKFYRHLGFQRCGIRPKSIKWQGAYDDEIELVYVL